MTTNITPKSELMELLYSKETEIINACILEGKDIIYENGEINIPFDKALNSEKKYTRDNLIAIADIFENYGWRVEILESDRIFYFS